MKCLLSDVCQIQYGYAFDSNKFSTTEGMPLVRIRDVVRGYSETYTTEDCKEEYEIRTGDMLIGMDGEFNIAKWHGGKAWLNQRVCKLIPSENVDSNYLFYFMPVALKHIEERTPFATVKHLSAKELNRIEVPLPPMLEQQKIAATLEEITLVIAHRRQQLAELDTLIKARFVEMFGDPVNNNRNWPQLPMSIVAPSEAAQNITSDPVWLLNLDMIEAQTGKIIDYLHVDISDIGASTCAFDTSNVLYSKLRPYLNKVVVPDKEGYCTTELVPLKPRNRLNRQFLAYLLRSDAFVSFISEKVAGAKMPRVSMGAFRDFLCILPPIDLQNQFAAFVEQVDKSKAAVQKALDEAQVLFDSLMQKYFG